MNVLCTKWMLYCQRPSFSGLELYASYDWRATAPNMHHGLFSICHFVCISSTYTLWDACNSTTHQKIPLLLRMLLFMLKAAKQLQPTCTSYDPVQTSLSCYFLHKYKWQQNSGCLRLYYNAVTIAFLPKLHPLEIQTEVRHRSCSPATIPVSLHYMYM